ncbi:hypothetical protein [Neobacillus bataviensis]|nr:hypothetical protein [Neobacillus bataviensis]
MNIQEKNLLDKTSIILGKNTGMMKLNDIIEELVSIIEQNENDERRN